MYISISNKLKFFVSYSLKSIVRNKRRYILFAVILFSVSLVIAGGFLLANAAVNFINAPENNIDEFDNLSEYIENQNKRTGINSIFFFSNIIILTFGVLGIIMLVFVTLLLLNERIYEVGVLFSIGMNKLYIFFSLLFETIVFMLAMMIAGLIAARGILEILFILDILPDLRNYMLFNYIFIIGIGLIFIIIPAFMILLKIINSSPLKLLKEKK